MKRRGVCEHDLSRHNVERDVNSCRLGHGGAEACLAQQLMKEAMVLQAQLLLLQGEMISEIHHASFEIHKTSANSNREFRHVLPRAILVQRPSQLHSTDQNLKSPSLLSAHKACVDC